MAKILLLGSGELGKELVISLQRLGQTIIACDSYEGAPAMQVADHYEVFNMLEASALERVIERHKPDFIVPEIEAIATSLLLEKEAQGYTIVPSAKAVDLTMNRDKIRDHAADLGLRTARFAYAETEQELLDRAAEIGGKLVVKPVMSSSGKGQSTATGEAELRASWAYAMAGMRGDRCRVIVEEFLDFDYEITLLTIRQHHADTVFCPPIGHVQARGDYQYSWQSAACSDAVIAEAQGMARKITDALGGAGLFGVEFFISKSGEVIFSELSPRPHDTGLVTLYTQNLSEFDLHARALLGLPIPSIRQLRDGASQVVLAAPDASGDYHIDGVAEALQIADCDIRLFGKPNARPYRRLGVVLGPDVETAQKAAQRLHVRHQLKAALGKPTEPC
jgi:phosphoribosylglycinamide formyltransferase 2